jgi:hypothetical protein
MVYSTKVFSHFNLKEQNKKKKLDQSDRIY